MICFAFHSTYPGGKTRTLHFAHRAEAIRTRAELKNAGMACGDIFQTIASPELLFIEPRKA